MKPAIEAAKPATEAAPKAKAPFWAGKAREAPPQKGQFPLPCGAEGCLEGKTFVITGAMRSLEREEMESLLKRYGGYGWEHALPMTAAGG